MAKGARASSIKANNQALKKNVYGPVETARTERLSAKLQALVSQPKPVRVKEDVAQDVSEPVPEVKDLTQKQPDAMELDQDLSTIKKNTKSGKGRIERKNTRKPSIVFPKYKNGSRVSKTKSKTKSRSK